jgi:hypothetical protein
MIAATTSPPGRNGSAVRGAGGVRRFAPAVVEIVETALARVDGEAPELASGPWRDRAAEAEFLREELCRRLELCERGADYDDGDVQRLAGHFADMARRGAPVMLVQRLCRSVTAGTFGELWSTAEPGDVTDLLRLSQWTARTNGTLEGLLVRTYRQMLDPERQRAERRTALAERLLAGLADQVPDDGPGLRPAPSYLVVLLSGPAPAGGDGLPAGTLSATVERRTHLLVPVPTPAARRAVWETVAAWARTADVVATGEFAARPADVRTAAATARRLVTVAEAVGTPPGLVPLSELTLETSLAADREGARRLAEVLDPLDPEPRLLTTLAIFFAEDLDRTRASTVLHLSRGGLSLRLERITRLTGLDPRTTRGIQVLGAALTARALLVAVPSS